MRVSFSVFVGLLCVFFVYYLCTVISIVFKISMEKKTEVKVESYLGTIYSLLT